MDLTKQIEKSFSWIALFLVIFLVCASSGFSALEAGSIPPEFKLTSLDGKEITLQQFQGKVVLLHLWKCQ